MKINLIFDLKNSLSGYTNIKVNDGDVSLDSIAEDAECTEILATDVISYFRAADVAPLIEQWHRKLRLHGHLIVGGVDLNEVARGIFNKTLSLTDANILLYGEQSEPWQFKQSGLSLSDLVEALHLLDLKILKKRINNYHYIVEAERVV